MRKLILIILLLPLFLKAQVTQSNYSGNSFTAKSFMNSPVYKLNGVAQTFSQWTTSTTKIYYNTGNVGIGTATPSYALDVVGTVNATNLYKGGALFSYNIALTGSPAINNAVNTLSILFFRTGSSGRWSLGKLANTETGSNVGADFGIYRYDDAGSVIDRPLYITRSTGHIGMGTETPFTKLTLLKGQSLGFEYQSEAASRRWWLGNDLNAYGDFAISTESTKGLTSPDLTRIYINAAGNIGIGTVTPVQVLDVVGNIKTSTYLMQQGIYAGIYVNDGSTAQSIANGVTYTKSTAFTTNGLDENCTADAANDKITLTKTGKYMVLGTCSFTSGTNSVVWYSAAFLGGTEQANIHWARKVGTGSDLGSASFMGIVNVSSVPVDLDVRFRQDQAGAINLTVVYSNLTVNYIGE